MRSSYKNNLKDYSVVFKLLCFMLNPTKVVEIGILDGFSLKQFAENCSKKCEIHAYDLFGDFNGNHSEVEIIKEFKCYDNVKIQKGDFYILHKDISNEIDIIHIDIANDGDIFTFAIENYLKHLKSGGILILEGGSEERDNVEWMVKYNKSKISPILENIKKKYEVILIEDFPSITIIKNV